MDEVFGSQNVLANCIWQKKYTRSNDATYFSDNHDHILVYAKKKQCFRMGRVERTQAQDKAYKNPDNHPLGPWKATPLHAKSGTSRESYTFKNGVTWSPPSGTFRRFNDVTLARLDDGNEIWFGSKGDAIPQRKTFLGSLEVGLTPVTLWTHEVAGDNHIGRDELKALLAGTSETFQTPKPAALLQLILQLSTDKDSLVLDSFAGSGSTGHAVLKQNNEDGGTRRFIQIEVLKDVAERVTSLRMSRVVSGYETSGGSNGSSKVSGLGGGFQYCRLSSEPLFDADGRIRPDVKFPQLAEFVWFAETGTGYSGSSRGPLLGIHEGRAIYLLYNGILGDRSIAGGNVLTGLVFDRLPSHAGPKVIYGAGNRMGARAAAEQVTFKQHPYALQV